MGTISKVAVIGAGIMGNGIAHVTARSGFSTIVIDVDENALHRADAIIQQDVQRSLDRGKISSRDADALLGRLSYARSIDDCVADADVVIEAVPEQMDLKQKILRTLDEICLPETILASNTSALSIGLMGATTSRPDKVLGLHFFYPVPISPAVEVVPSLATSHETLDLAREFVRALGKEILMAKDSPGFITNRLLAVLLNEAFDLVREGMASPDEIDRACTLIFGHPIGPLKLADLIGLDTGLSVLSYLHQELGERYRPSPLLKALVNVGHFGIKSGKGVHQYKSSGSE